MTHYVWYNAKLNEIKDFTRLGHLLLKIYEREGHLVFLGKL